MILQAPAPPSQKKVNHLPASQPIHFSPPHQLPGFAKRKIEAKAASGGALCGQCECGTYGALGDEKTGRSRWSLGPLEVTVIRSSNNWGGVFFF